MKSLLLSIFLSFASVYAYSQGFEVKGTVVDASGSPLPGVSIVVKNTTNGSSTDFDGNFTLANVENGQTLVFSYVGFVNKEIVVNDVRTLDVVLAEDLQSLEEVVVVGYGKTMKRDLTNKKNKAKSIFIIKKVYKWTKEVKYFQ